MMRTIMGNFLVIFLLHFVVVKFNMAENETESRIS